MVGGVCTIVQLSAFYVLNAMGVPGFLAFSVTFAACAQLNFVLSDRFTWGKRRDLAGRPRAIFRRWLLFNTAALLSLAVSSITFAILTRLVGTQLAAPCGVAAAMSVSFLAGDRLIFKQRSLAGGFGVSPTAVAPSSGGTSEQDVAAGYHQFTDEIGRGVSIFLPAYNEGENLPVVVEQTLLALNRISPAAQNLIIVNDGSTDDTAVIADSLAVLHSPRVHVVHHEKNQGYGHVLRSGFAAGLRHDSDWVGFVDSDGQFDPDQFQRLVAVAHRERADLVVGYRIKRADGFARLLAGRAWQMLTRLMVGIGVHDVDCGFKLVHRNVLEGIELRGSFAAVSPELIVKARRAGFRTVEVGVDHFPRRAGEQTGANPRVILRSLIGLVKLRASLSRRGESGRPDGHPGSAFPPKASGVALVASAVSILSFGFFYSRGQTLAYDDSISHLLIAKRTLQGATPGLAQLGSVWLPLPHLVMAPFTVSNYLFYTGIGGSIISMAAFVATAVLLFKTAALMTDSRAAGWIAAFIFIADPNMLYLQSTPMTESLLFACIAAAVYQLLRWSISDDWRHLAMCALAVFLATLTRYEGWVLLASVVVSIGYVMLRRGYGRGKSEAHAIFFLTVGAAGVLGWLLWNRIIFGSFLNFATGKYAKPSLWVSGADRAPGHLLIAIKTYLIAATETVGAPFLVLALAGLGVHLWRAGPRAESVAPLSLLVFLPFFVVALYTGQRPLHVTQVSGDLYNTRFGVVMLLPAALFGALALLAAGKATGRASGRVASRLRRRTEAASSAVQVQSRRPERWTAAAGVAALAVLLLATSAAATQLSHGVVTLDEPLHWNSSRASATAAAALRQDYTGGRVLMQGFGNEYAEFASHVPIGQTIYEGSYQLWQPALRDPAAHGIDWIYMTKSATDQVWQSLHGSARLNAYVSVYDDGTRVIYRLRTAPTPSNVSRAGHTQKKVNR